MAAMLSFFGAQPGWAWMAFGALCLAGELLTGSGYLLWPSACAGAVGVMVLAGAPLPLVGQIGLFVALTVVSTLAARRWLPRRLRPQGPDVNDTRSRLVGHEGEGVACPGSPPDDGRVFIDGKEWSAELVGGGPPLPGQRVRVEEVLGGARLKVSPL